MEVLENRENPKGKKLSLPVVLLHSTKQHRFDDPILYIPGGPGDGGWLDTERISFWWDFIRHNEWLQERDVILYDPRGTGMTAPRIDCPEMEAIAGKILELGNAYDEANRVRRQAATACYQRLTKEGFDLTQYSSAINAQDLHELLLALGKRSWNLYGLSYGTRFALTYMRDYPADLRSVILDSVLPPEVNFFEDTAWFVNHALDTLAEGCARSHHCRQYGDLNRLYNQIVPELNAHPILVPVHNPRGGDDIKVNFTGDAFINFVFDNLYNRSDIEALPARIRAVANKDPKALHGAAEDLVEEALQRPDFGEAMSNSIDCLEEAPYNSNARMQANFSAYPLLAGLALSMDIEEDCAAWVVAKADKKETAPVVSTLPVLLLAGRYDPVTPPNYARLTAARLDNAQLFEFPGVGHDVLSNDSCADRVAEKFLNDPLSPAIVDCLGQLEEPDFQ